MEFKKIQLQDKPIIDDFVKRADKNLSDINFNNLYIWRNAREIFFTIIEKTLIIKTIKNDEEYYFYPITDDETKAHKALEKLISSGTRKYKSLLANEAEILQKDFGFAIEENRDDFDYIYNIAELIELNGRKYHKKKNHLNKFYANYNFTYEAISSDNALVILEDFRAFANLSDSGLRAEFEGIKDVLENFNSLKLEGGSIKINGKFIAFSLGEKINSSTAVIHIEKAKSDILGGYQAINSLFLQNSFSHLTYVNRENDLGIEGLRKAKLSYQPCFLVSKFTASNG